MGPYDPKKQRQQDASAYNQDFQDWYLQNKAYLEDTSKNPGLINSVPRRLYNTWQNLADLGLSERRLGIDSSERQKVLDAEYEAAQAQGSSYKPSSAWTHLKRGR